MKRILITALTAIMLNVGIAQAGTFEDATTAYKRGDYVTAAGKFAPIAEAGHYGAQYHLALMYAQGLGVKKDNEAAFRWLKLAAEQGFWQAQYGLAQCYESGTGVPQDDAAAEIWFLLAAGQGHVDAQHKLGGMYGLTGKKDYPKSIKWYRLAAGQGNRSSQLMLGIMYAQGLGVPQDYARAHMWYNLAATEGDFAAITLREEQKDKMTPQQVALAQQLARECLARNFKKCD